MGKNDEVKVSALDAFAAFMGVGLWLRVHGHRVPHPTRLLMVGWLWWGSSVAFQCVREDRGDAWAWPFVGEVGALLRDYREGRFGWRGAGYVGHALEEQERFMLQWAREKLRDDKASDAAVEAIVAWVASMRAALASWPCPHCRGRHDWEDPDEPALEVPCDPARAVLHVCLPRADMTALREFLRNTRSGEAPPWVSSVLSALDHYAAPLESESGDEGGQGGAS